MHERRTSVFFGAYPGHQYNYYSGSDPFFECVESNADLWDIHKGSYQRSCRQGKTSKASESTDIIHAWIRKIFLSVPGLTREPLVKDGLGLADLSYGRERDSGVRVYYSKRLKRALESGKWSLKLPHSVLHRCNSEEHGLYGDVHVLTSSERPGQFKVGATTIPLDKRVYIYQRRYFTKISVYENFFCQDPFGIEKTLWITHRTGELC